MMVFCLGLPKTGLEAAKQIFSYNFKVEHNPLQEKFMHVIMKEDIGLIDDFLLEKSKLNLDVECSSLNAYVLDRVVRLFPDAKFILLVRDCVVWLGYFLKHCIVQQSEDWKLFWDWLFAPSDMVYVEKEKYLAEANLYPLARYISHWGWYYSTVLDIVPKDKLLVINMININNSTSAIAKFVGVPSTKLKFGFPDFSNNGNEILDKMSYEHLLTSIESIKSVRQRLKLYL